MFKIIGPLLTSQSSIPFLAPNRLYLKGVSFINQSVSGDSTQVYYLKSQKWHLEPLIFHPSVVWTRVRHYRKTFFGFREMYPSLVWTAHSTQPNSEILHFCNSVCILVIPILTFGNSNILESYIGVPILEQSVCFRIVLTRREVVEYPMCSINYLMKFFLKKEPMIVTHFLRCRPNKNSNSDSLFQQARFIPRTHTQVRATRIDSYFRAKF